MRLQLLSDLHLEANPHCVIEPAPGADLLVLDVQAGGLAGVPLSHQLDALVFATEAPAFDEVWVAGERCVAGGRHRRQAELGAGFVEAMQGLWPAG